MSLTEFNIADAYNNGFQNVLPCCFELYFQLCHWMFVSKVDGDILMWNLNHLDVVSVWTTGVIEFGEEHRNQRRSLLFVEVFAPGVHTDKMFCIVFFPSNWNYS